MKPERNDPCPCGSGKKFKKCCASAVRPERVEISYEFETSDLAWRLDETTIIASKQFMKFIEKTGLERTEVIEATVRMHQNMRERGWLKDNCTGIVLEYRDDIAPQMLNSGGPPLVSTNGFHLSIVPFTLEHFVNSDFVCLFPKQFSDHDRIVAEETSRELAREYSLYVLCHEIAHAFGAGYRTGEQRNSTREKFLEEVADAMSSLTVWPPERATNLAQVFPFITYASERAEQDGVDVSSADAIYAFVTSLADRPAESGG